MELLLGLMGIVLLGLSILVWALRDYFWCVALWCPRKISQQ